MEIEEQKKNWDRLGQQDPMWAISTNGPKGRAWDSTKFFDTGVQLVEDVLRHCETLPITVNREGRALDFGCGLGRITQPLCRHFEEVYGIDVAPSMIAQAIEHNQYGEQCHYFVNEDYDIRQFPDAHFDFVLTYAVLQHIEPKYVKQYINAFLRLLKPDGVLVFQEHAVPLGFAPRFKNFIKMSVPRSVLQYWHRRRYASATEGIMEVYGIPKSTMVAFLEKSGARVMDVMDAPVASGTWSTYQYTVKK